MSCDQHEALVTATPGIDAMQGNFAEEERSVLEGLKDACGESPHPRWLIPVPAPSKKRLHTARTTV